jgi:O-antigen ligase
MLRHIAPRSDTLIAPLFALALLVCQYTSDVSWGMYVPALLVVAVFVVYCRIGGALTLSLKDFHVAVATGSAVVLLAISVCCSPNPYISLIDTQSFLVLFGTLMAVSGRDAKSLKHLSLWGGAVMVPFVLQGVFQAISQGVNAHAAMHDSNLMAGYLTAGSAACLATCVSDRIAALRRSMWAAGVMACVLALGAYVGHSRGAWLALTVATLVSLWATKPQTGIRFRRIVLIVAAITVVGLICVTPKTERDASQHDGYGQSTNSRLAMWRATAHMIEAHPFKGVGFGLWHLYYPGYRTADDTDSAGYRAHNDYLEAWASGGLPGALAVGSIPLLFD